MIIIISMKSWSITVFSSKKLLEVVIYPKGKAPLGMQEYFIELHLKESGVDRDDILRKGAVSVVR